MNHPGYFKGRYCAVKVGDSYYAARRDATLKAALMDGSQVLCASWDDAKATVDEMANSDLACRASNGGPAFPVPGNAEGYAPNQFGISQRDYFAAQALTVAYQEVQDSSVEGLCRLVGSKTWDPNSWTLAVALRSYQIADAMLKAREADYA